MISKEKEVPLPKNEAELDAFIAGIVKDFKIPAGDDTSEAIATAILHLDNRIGRVKRSYFADNAIKFLANKAAYEKIQGFREAAKALEAKKKEGEAKTPAEPDVKH